MARSVQRSLESIPSVDASAGRARFPAWLSSAALHVLGLCCLAVLLHRPAVPVAETRRSVGIVLARVAEEVAYLEAPQQEASSPAESSTSSTSSGRQSPFPAAENNVKDALDSPDLPGELQLGAGSGLLEELVDSTGGESRILPGLGDEEILANDPLRNRPTEKLGPTATVSVFGTRAAGRSFVFLIDRSKSMGGEGLGAIEAAERELIKTLVALGPEQKFQIVAYNQQLAAADEKMISASAANKTKAGRFLAGIVAHGQTEHYMALAAALRSGPEVIYVLTDAGDPKLSDPQIRTLVLRAKGKTTIHCIHFGYGPLQDKDPFLRKLARLAGGGYAYIDMSQSRSRRNQ